MPVGAGAGLIDGVGVGDGLADGVGVGDGTPVGVTAGVGVAVGVVSEFAKTFVLRLSLFIELFSPAARPVAPIDKSAVTKRVKIAFMEFLSENNLPVYSQ